MAKELNIVLGQSGLSVTANVYLLGVAAATGIACPEIGTTGEYSGNFSATPNTAGIYQVVFFTDGGVLACGGGQIVWDGTAEVTSGTIPTAQQNADALLDRAAGVETNRTLRQALRLMLAALAGKASGLDTLTARFRDTNDSVDRIVATVDVNGNRTAVTLDPS
jgi:hypothetical protein